LATRNPQLKAHFKHASEEETDHLAWTEVRLADLGARPSLLNPLWYAGAFGLGYVAGKLGGDALSLGFVVETERQVEAHLHSHLARLPAGDTASIAVVKAMAHDEAHHAREAQRAGNPVIEYPRVRIWGTVGFMIPSLLLYLWLQRSSDTHPAVIGAIFCAIL
jgi:ubiquinone biosynthesis monooxygenase Coq7